MKLHFLFFFLHTLFVGYEITMLIAVYKYPHLFSIFVLILNAVCAVLHWAIIENELNKK